MENKKIIRFAQSLILLPIMTMSGSAQSMPNMGVIARGASQVVFTQKQNTEDPTFAALKEAAEKEARILEIKANAVDTYFKDRGMPMAGYGMKMVLEAEKNDLDWRLVAAIAVRESTGGKFECKKADFNAFGWGSCKIHFKSNEDAIETVARNLGGNNPKTAHHYDNKTTMQILRAYNPPSIVKRYAEQVIAIMDAIGDAEVVIPQNS